MVLALEGQVSKKRWIPTESADFEKPTGNPSKSVGETTGCLELRKNQGGDKTFAHVLVLSPNVLCKKGLGCWIEGSEESDWLQSPLLACFFPYSVCLISDQQNRILYVWKVFHFLNMTSLWLTNSCDKCTIVQSYPGASTDTLSPALVECNCFYHWRRNPSKVQNHRNGEQKCMRVRTCGIAQCCH